VLLFLMALAPLLPWGGAAHEVLRDRMLVPAWVGAGSMALALVLGAGGLANVAAYGLGGFAIAGVARQYAAGVRARRARTGEGRLRALRGVVRSRPSLYGGLVVHVGVVVVAVALAASAGSLAREEVRLARGESATVEGVKVTFLELDRSADAQKSTVTAHVRVVDHGRDLGTYSPAISSYPNFNGGIGTPSVHTGFVRDVYLTLVSSGGDGGGVTIGVAVNPMVVWLWIGGAVMAIGTVLAILPTRAERRARTTGAAGHESGGAPPDSGEPGDSDEPDAAPEPVTVA
jgi:cytochrome c-type biogenesis protein CcmF